MSKSKVEQYKVWVHIEGLNKDGDCIEGDNYHEPREAGCTETLEQAERLRDTLLEVAGGLTLNQPLDRKSVYFTKFPKWGIYESMGS